MTAPTRTLLALNLGSTSLKGARFVHEAGTDRWIRERRATIEFDAGPQQSSDHGLRPLAEHLFENSAPDIIAHRIVHGGDRERGTELDTEILAELETLSPLAPLHQPQALDLVRRAGELWPAARQWAAFDTSWHATMPMRHRVLPLPKPLFYQGVKRYGFHGLAFQSAMRQLRVQYPGCADGRVVLAHLGGGSSVCAVRGGNSVNTTMGMTPLGGIPMGSRPGSLDPGVVLYLQRALGFSTDAVDRLLWRESGLKGLSGESADMRVLLASRSDDAKLAIDVYVGAVVQAIAAMAACIGGIDALVFTGGIGVHAVEVRQRIVDDLAWLGLRPNGAEPDANGEAVAQVFAMDVDEETELAVQWRLAQASDAIALWK